jgi:hypothetical protein
MPIPAQQHAEIIEPRNNALQLHSVHEEDRERDFGFANMIEESVLQILRSFSGHSRCSIFLLVSSHETVVA